MNLNGDVIYFCPPIDHDEEPIKRRVQFSLLYKRKKIMYSSFSRMVWVTSQEKRGWSKFRVMYNDNHFKIHTNRELIVSCLICCQKWFVEFIDVTRYASSYLNERNKQISLITTNHHHFFELICSYSHNGLEIWNSLPVSVTRSSILPSFKTNNLCK